ncbi:hypothetical protein DPX16_3317 [Anabarilius grahami]|uniref:Uncharacterized protein n=1 Tax=Anabarilius grahami TaxID=495550 RepID=A0A3N0XLA3_ANAGA|nr:hypothetical protein DPX16_3317 [Anabarilius grahami]
MHLTTDGALSERRSVIKPFRGTEFDDMRHYKRRSVSVQHDTCERFQTLGAGLWKQSGAQKEDDASQKITGRRLTHTDPDGSRCDSHRLSAGHNELLNHRYNYHINYLFTCHNTTSFYHIYNTTCTSIDYDYNTTYPGNIDNYNANFTSFDYNYSYNTTYTGNIDNYNANFTSFDYNYSYNTTYTGNNDNYNATFNTTDYNYNITYTGITTNDNSRAIYTTDYHGCNSCQSTNM